MCRRTGGSSSRYQGFKCPTRPCRQTRAYFACNEWASLSGPGQNGSEGTRHSPPYPIQELTGRSWNDYAKSMIRSAIKHSKDANSHWIRSVKLGMAVFTHCSSHTNCSRYAPVVGVCICWIPVILHWSKHIPSLESSLPHQRILLATTTWFWQKKQHFIRWSLILFLLKGFSSRRTASSKPSAFGSIIRIISNQTRYERLGLLFGWWRS